MKDMHQVTCSLCHDNLYKSHDRQLTLEGQFGMGVLWRPRTHSTCDGSL